jgi:hypothetical protein
MLVTLAIPAFFLAAAFDLFDDDKAKMFGVLSAIFAGLIWSGSDYVRILVGAGPKENDEESIREYYSATKLGTLVRCVGLTLGFACPMLLVYASMEFDGNHLVHEKVIKFTGIICGILCAVVYSYADQVEEFFYGRLKE